MVKDKICLFNKVSKEGYEPFFIVALEHMEEKLDINSNYRDNFDFLLLADQEYEFDGNTFTKRKIKETIYFEMDLLNEKEFKELNENYKKEKGYDIPTGSHEYFIECYAKSLGFKDFNDFSSKFNLYLESNKNKR